MLVKNISFLGHKDHGKSTLIGSLLMQTGSATQVRINEAKAYSKKLHKAFEPAFILDSFVEEREQEMTYDTTRAEIKYKNIAFALIDVPGHEELIKNMISGASYGEIALLLVSAKSDEGIRDQTKRHLFISRMLGIDRLVVAVNKMDLVGYKEERFEEIKNGLSNFIEKIGFEKKNIHFVPISAYKGENLVKRSTKMKWYKGNTILEMLYQMSEGRRPSGKDRLRITVQGRLEGESGEDLIVGKVVKGSVKLGDEVRMTPYNETSPIGEIVVKGKRVKRANAGENVALEVLTRGMVKDVRGSVISGKLDPLIPKDSIKATIFVAHPLGKDLKMRFNGLEVLCNSIKMLKYVDVTTGTESAKGKAEPLSAVVAELKLSKKIPAERYDQTPELGRFVLYSGKSFAGIGIVR
ncbi:MAG TPA: GTP-binding protein [Candidatus Acidoferrum sp.]|nr:GTP-binding protein [Candidatus Acidoferrum sp.]